MELTALQVLILPTAGEIATLALICTLALAPQLFLSEVELELVTVQHLGAAEGVRSATAPRAHPVELLGGGGAFSVLG